MEFRRITNLPPYVFAIINGLKIEARRAGVDVIDLGFGNPDLPSPAVAVDKLIEAVQNLPPGQLDLYDVRSDCRHPTLLSSLPDLNFIVDTQGNFIYANKAMADLYGMVNVPQAVWIDAAGRIVRAVSSTRSIASR